MPWLACRDGSRATRPAESLPEPGGGLFGLWLFARDVHHLTEHHFGFWLRRDAALNHSCWFGNFDKLGYLRIKGARGLDPETLGVLRELFLMRDHRAREIDRPPFKVLGNRTLLDIAELSGIDLGLLTEKAESLQSHGLLEEILLADG